MIRRRGYFFADAIVALGILTAVAVLLVTGRTVAQRAARAADDERTAVRIAERYLAERTRPAATMPSDAVTESPLATPAPAGWQWVSVRATVNKRSAELVALVRKPS